MRLHDASRLGEVTSWYQERGPYAVRFARTEEDRERVQRLRFEVFARELGATVQGADRGLDVDPLDARADHLMVVERTSGECVGTYRLATLSQVGAQVGAQAGAQAGDAPGFYTCRIFDLNELDARVARDGVELGRACVAIQHRTRGVFQLLLRGIGAYLARSGKQFLFGCGSVPLKDPGQARMAIEEIEREGWLDVSLPVLPTPAYTPTFPDATSGARPEIPALLYVYCGIGARLASAPAYDPDFRTLDFFVLLDLERVEPRAYARYCDPR